MSIQARKLYRAVRPKLSQESLEVSNVQSAATAASVTLSWQTSIPATSHAAIYFGPAKHCSWNWQLQGALDTTADAQVYDIDGFDIAKSAVASLQSAGRYVIAYFSGGSWEDWRSDAADFPSSVLGSNLDGWEGEKWLDIRQIDTLRSIMLARVDIAKAKGFNAIEWDNVDGYQQATGFTLTSAEQVAYNKMLAQITHERGLACFLKNSVDLVTVLEPFFEGVVIEEAYRYNEAAGYIQFPQMDKPGLVCEYRDSDVSLANQNDANAKGFSLIRHNLDLDTKYVASYVVDPAPAVVLTDTASPKSNPTLATSHTMTFTGLTAGQRYGFLVWSEAGGVRVYDSTPRTFTAV